MNTCTEPVLNLAALVSGLKSSGYIVTQDVVLEVSARKVFQTAVGPREATISVFRAAPGRVYPSFHSEGRNILESYSWDFSMDISKALDDCERAIDASFARRLFLRGVVIAAS